MVMASIKVLAITGLLILVIMALFWFNRHRICITRQGDIIDIIETVFKGWCVAFIILAICCVFMA